MSKPLWDDERILDDIGTYLHDDYYWRYIEPHIHKMRDEYEERVALLLAACERYLAWKTGVQELNETIDQMEAAVARAKGA